MTKPEKKRTKTDGKEECGVLVKMFRSGKLGRYPLCLDRFRAGVRLMQDYRFSSFVPKITSSYDETAFIRSGRHGSEEWCGGRQAAAQRYLDALKYVWKYGVYVLHFLRDEENVRSFIFKHHVLNEASVTTYRAVYKALCETLDLLAEFYAKEDEK